MQLMVKNMETGEVFPFDGIHEVTLTESDIPSLDEDVARIRSLESFEATIEFPGGLAFEKWFVEMLKHPRKKNRALKRRIRKFKEALRLEGDYGKRRRNFQKNYG